MHLYEFENNEQNSGNQNSNENRHNITNNNKNLLQTPKYRSENSQNYSQANTQQTIKTPQQVMLTKKSK